MSETEDRLTSLEQAISNIQEGINAIKHDPLSESINTLTIQLATLTTTLQHTTRVLVKRRGGSYHPWGEEQQALLTHKYVAREVFVNVLWRALRVVGNLFTGWKVVHHLLDTIPSNTIALGTRFPPHGLYININNFDVFHLLQQLKEHSYKASAEANEGCCTRRFKEIVSQLQTLALANVGSGGTVGMIHDRNSFEEEYNLQWVELGSERDEGRDSREEGATITGLTTTV